jgi:hypothetical protein
MNVHSLDIKGRVIAQEVYNEIEKIARFKINTLDDLKKARKQVADFTKMVAKEPEPKSFRYNPMDMRGSRKKSLDKELRKMQNDLRDSEVELRDRGVGAMKRYSRNPSDYSKNADEPDIKQVEAIMDEINRNRTKKRGIFFKNDVKVDVPKKKAEAPKADKLESSNPKQGILDRTAKKVGYGVMAGGVGYGGYKAYQNKKNSGPYGGGY